MSAALYFCVSKLSIINFLPYQNPKAYSDKNMVSSRPWLIEVKRQYLTLVFLPSYREASNFIS
jgi:hypothetical protein